MTVFERVRRTQRLLGAVAVAIALCWAGAVVVGILALGTVMAGLADLGSPVWMEIALIAALAGLTVLGAVAWRLRFVWSSSRVALWIEEQAPELRYTLVSALDPRYAELAPALDPVIRRVDIRVFERRVVRRSMLPAFAALVATGIAFAAVPESWKARVGRIEPSVGGLADTAPSRLAAIVARVTPPGYALRSGVAEQTLANPTTVEGLAGSQVEVRSGGGAAGIEARLGETAIPVSGSETGWSITFVLPDSAELLRLVDRHNRRLIVVAPRHDETPVVQLLLPASDTTVRTVSGYLALEAVVTDDVGLATAQFEYIVSSGESEGDFRFSQGTLAQHSFDNAKSGRISVTVPLRSFQLREGGQLQIRALAVDNNNVSGPDSGYSETRVLRVARQGEYDSLAVEGASPPTDTALVTIRYLIQVTQELHANRQGLARDSFVSHSRSIGNIARRMVQKLEQMQDNWTFTLMFPPNQFLTTALEELWGATRSLWTAETGRALPHLWKSLRAMQQFLFVRRYYIRGRLPEVLADVARVRLAGTDTGQASRRFPRERADTAARVFLRGYVNAVRMLRSAPDSSIERLMLMQVEALREYPIIAPALGAAVAAIREGRDPGPALQRVRDLLEGRSTVIDSIPGWSGVW